MILKKSLRSKTCGQSTVEYIIISAAMAAIFFLGFVDFFGESGNPLSLFAMIKNAAVGVYDNSYTAMNGLSPSIF